MKKEFITKVNDKINNLMKEHEDLLSVLGSTYNLKLHDIAYEANEEDYNEYFELFCNINYQAFEEFTKENDCNLIQVGRTSSFFIVDNENIIDEYGYKSYDLQQSNNNFEKIIFLLEYYLNSEYTGVGFNISDMVTIDYNKQLIEDIGSNLMDFFREYKEYLRISPLEIFINDFDIFINNYFHGITEVADYINNFKENQLKLWNVFIEEQKEMEEE